MCACKTLSEVYSFSTYGNILTEAFQTDVENFLLLFRQRSSLKFTDFAATWRSTKFSFIYSEQRYYFLLQQLTDNCFFVLMKFILFPEDIHTQVGAIYLLYGLYFKQLVQDWVKIRITQDEHEKLQRIMKELSDKEHLEPIYCYTKLVVSNAFEYVFQKKPLAPENLYLKGFKEPLDDVFKSGRAGTTYSILQQRLNENDFLKIFTQVSADYEQALAEFAVSNPGIETCNSTIVQEIESTLNCVESMDKPEASNIDEENTIYSRRREIKNRAISTKTLPKCRMMKIEDENFSDF